MKCRHHKVIAFAFALALVGAAGLASASQATSPGRNGRIAYMVKDNKDHEQIWVANADLSGAEELTHGHFDSGWAVWSPDGTRLAFDSNQADHTPKNSRHVNDVFVMNADGSGVRKLTHSRGVSENAAWSPDGSRIAFDAGSGIRKWSESIYIVRASGGRPRRITRPAFPATDFSPRFSPDGTRLVFTRARGDSENAPAAIFTVRVDGSGLRRLTPYRLGTGDADWSPDGKRIVFAANPRTAPFGDIFVLGATGGKAVDLTKNPVVNAGSSDPVWSPDGQEILFFDNRYVHGVGRSGLATMSPDGSARQFIGSENVEAEQPDWESIPPAPARKLAPAHTKVRNGPLTLFSTPANSVAHIVTVGYGRHTTLWHCPTPTFCGTAVSFAWAPDGRRVAFTLDEIGGNSAYVGFHVVNVATGQDMRIPGGAPTTETIEDPAAWGVYLKKMLARVGCYPAANLAWSADGSRLAYNCGSEIDVLALHGTGHTTVPTGSDAFWPSWSPSGTRLAYSTHLKPLKSSSVYTVALDGSHRRLIARGATAPAWSPDGRTIAYQTRCGIRLATPTGRVVFPGVTAKTCGAGSEAGPPVWSPDGTKLGFETADFGTSVIDRSGRHLHSVGFQLDSTTWYGGLPGRPSWRAVR